MELQPLTSHDLRYSERVNRVIDYISGHLDEELTLARLSQVGCFSPFHFHRIFQDVTGATLNSHVRRVRLERAASLMKASHAKRITDVALEVGFAGTAEFSRAFKQHFGLAPSAWDRRSGLEKSKISQAPESHPAYTREELERWQGEIGQEVGLQGLGTFRYAYIRTFNPYSNMRLVASYHALMAWLSDRGTDVRDIVVIGMSLDDPAITPPEKCSYDMGVAFPDRESVGLLREILRSRGREAIVQPSREECAHRQLSVRDFEPLRVAGFHCDGDLGLVDRAWQYLYRVWLPSSSFDPADVPAMEVFVRLPEEIGWETFDLYTCLPVVRP